MAFKLKQARMMGNQASMDQPGPKLAYHKKSVPEIEMSRSNSATRGASPNVNRHQRPSPFMSVKTPVRKYSSAARLGDTERELFEFAGAAKKKHSKDGRSMSSLLEPDLMASISLADQLKLSTYQCQQLHHTNSKVQGSHGYHLSDIFRTISRQNSSAREMFQKLSIVDGFAGAGAHKSPDTREHGRLLGELFDFAIKHLQKPSRLTTDKCFEVGHSHCPVSGRGFSAQMWDQLGDCLTDFIGRNESVRKNREVTKAWITLLSFLIDNMKCGYQTGVKRRHSSLALLPQTEGSPAASSRNTPSRDSSYHNFT